MPSSPSSTSLSAARLVTALALALVLLAYLLLIVLLTGCGGLAGTSGINDLSLVLQVDQSRGAVGQPVHITFTISRGSQDGQPLGAIEAPDGESVMDITVGVAPDYDAQWSKQQTPENILHRLDLKPGESKTIQLTWTPQQDTGYSGVVIQGVLQGKGHIWQAAGVLLPVH